MWKSSSYELQLLKQTLNLKSEQKNWVRTTDDLVKNSIHWLKVNTVNYNLSLSRSILDPSRSTLDQIEIELNQPVFLNWIRFQLNQI